MNRLTEKVSRRIMAVILSIAMIMPNMTVYASEYSESAVKTEDTVDNTETGAVELPSTNDETVQDDAAQEEGTQDGTVQDEETTLGEDPDSTEKVDGDEEPAQDGTDENVPEEKEPEAEAVSADLEAEEPNENVTRATAHTVWIVGDSTVCSFKDNYYYPRYGYGTQIEEYFKENSGYTVNNLALSGRSSLSFLGENNYKTTLKEGIKEGDILIVGFGHNDEKAEKDRYTNPNGTSTTPNSFAKTLYDNYVKMAKDKGAEVILCTPVVRRSTDVDANGNTKLPDSNKHITKTSGSYEGGDYRKAIVDLGAEVNVPVVDLTKLTTDLYEGMKPEDTKYFHAWTQSKDSSVDNTHLNIYGAKRVAYMFANEVKTKDYTALASAIADNITEPTKADDLDTVYPVANWKDPEYKAPAADPATSFAPYIIGDGDKQVKFIGTAFGNLGGDSKVSAYTLEKDSLGYMHVVGTGNGKLITEGEASDGLAMYYYRVPKDSMFKISATAVVNSIDKSNNQSAFGLMARDDMYINKGKDIITNTNYVAAASVGGTGAYNCFYRDNTEFKSNSKLTVETVEAGGSYDLSIVRNSDGYACTFGNEPTQSGGYDISLTVTDSEYIYIGMFVTRISDITFKNIYLEVDGQVLVNERKDQFDITVTDDGNGTASALPMSAAEDDTITLTATPKDGYILDHWEVKDETDKTINVVNDQFTMPASDVTVKAYFAAINFDTASVAAGTKDFTQASAALTGFTGVTFANVEDTDNAHGFHTAEANKHPIVNLNLDITGDKTANITVLTCSGEATSATRALTSSTGAVFEKEVDDGSLKGTQYSIEKIDKEHVTLTLANNMYIHSILVEYITPDNSNKVDVWDFGAKVETAEYYRNKITAVELSSVVKMNGSYVTLGDGNAGGTAEFGDDLTINYGKGDRIYADKDKVTISGITFPTLDNLYKEAYSDGYSAEGGWYSNGARNASTGYALIDVNAGDKVIVYVGNHLKTDDTDTKPENDTENNYVAFTFAGQGEASAQSDVTNTIAGRGFEKFEFVAKYTGTYKFYQSSAGTGRPFYNRIVRIPTVTVSGKINVGSTGISGYGLTFINKTDDSLPNVTATVDANGNYTAQLSAGYQYKALLTGSGTSGYGIKFTNNADKVTTEISNVVNGITKDFEVVSQNTYTYSGTIEGFAPDYSRVSNVKITMVPAAGFDVNEEELTINKVDMSFSAGLQPDAVYTLKMEGVNDYEVTGPSQVSIANNTDLTGQTITVGLKPTYSVTGGFIGLGDNVTVQSLTFKNMSDNYVYTATVDNKDAYYTVSLRDGEYLASATLSDTSYSTTTHVIVNGGMVSQDLYFKSPEDTSAIDYEANIYVGYPKQAHNYKTVSEAVKAAGRMKKNGQARTASERVTIHIAPGTYREQIIVNTPYVSFVNDTNEEVLLTWYYGIGYVYYSAGSNGLYDAEKAYDKYTKHGVDRWGCAVRVTANNFQAKNITFENSFNRYITDEELEDGVESDVSYGSGYYDANTTINVSRNYTTDVRSKAATERAAAIVIEKDADYAEFYQCSFLGSQDTVYTSKTAYFRNCLLEGMTDYLFGDGDVVFDNCELSWKGYSDNATGGYITAVKDDAAHGYLFRNCTVTANGNLIVSAGDFGRPWGQGAKVTFVNTKLATKDLISAKGWGDMSGATAANANFKEYNTTTLDGSTITYSSPRSDKKVDSNPLANVDVKATYLNGWTPEYYTADGTETVTFGADPGLSDNGDINVPNPGHTLTVNYTLSGADAKNDASIIKWYIVENKDDDLANATPVKVSTAVVDKTYKITTAASGKYIKVEVTPETIDGRTGDAKTAVLNKAVGDKYVDPSSGSNITVGDGINVYLAGDSTVKDYSSKGMWNGGTQSEDLGSWGEYLQSFFNESEVTVQNFAQGGRSVRSFINDDTLKGQEKFSVIKENISEGDYLFIQFGHNDSSTEENKKDVYTPIGAKGSDGKYPYTADDKAVADKDASYKYADYYTYTDGAINWGGGDANGKATYCWFLTQYIEMALAKGAIPVLMTPVSRMNYGSDGKTKTHHADEHNTSSYYWEAVEQVYNDYKGRGVLFIDTYSLTKNLFDEAYKDGGAGRGKEIMSISDNTHNNKLGGIIEAMLVAEAIQKLNTPLAYAVKTPAQIGGSTTTEKTVFSIDSSSTFTAYEQKFTGSGKEAVYTNDTFTTKSDYWTSYGNTKLASISDKAGELADSNVSTSVVAAPTATSVMDTDANGKITVTVTLSSSTTGNVKIYYTDDGATSPKSSDGKGAATDATLYDDTEKIVLTQDTTIKAFAMIEDADQDPNAKKTPSKVVTFTFSVTPDVKAPKANYDSGSTVPSGTVITLESDTEGAEIRYTMGDGSKTPEPTLTSRKYNDEGIALTNSTTIKAIAVMGGVKSSVATFNYVVDTNVKGTVITPTANIASGETVGLNQKITLASSTPYAEIHYTTDGIDPTKDSALYKDTDAIKIKADMVKDGKVVIKAIALRDDMNDSEIATFTYTYNSELTIAAANPEANPKSGSKVKLDDTITLSSSTAGAKIVYTTDGSVPSSTSTNAVASPVSVTITNNIVSNKKVTIRAIAICDGMEASGVEIFTYEVEGLSGDDGDDDDDNNDDKDGLVIKFVKGDTYTYTGVAIKPEIEVRNNGTLLIPGTDYTVRYSNNINVPTNAKKQPTVTVMGKGILSGKVDKEFTINPKSINDKDVIAGSMVVIAGKTIPVPAIYYAGVKLANNRDFTYDNREKLSVDTTDDEKGYSVKEITVKGKGNYFGTGANPAETKVKVIVAKDATAQRDYNKTLKKFNVTVNNNKAKLLKYNGTDLETQIIDAIEVTTKDRDKTSLTKGTHYKLVLPEDTTNAGTVKFAVVGIGDYSGCNLTKTCKILPRNITQSDASEGGSGVTVADGEVLISGIPADRKATFTSTGAIFPDMKLTYGSGSSSIDMKLGVDYKVSYSANKKAGSGKDSKAKYTITFMGNYKGRYTSTSAFDIDKAELDTDTAKVVIPDMVCNGSPGVYKSKPYVTIDGVTLKASEYKVTYYLEDPTEYLKNPTDKKPKEMDNGENKVTFGTDEIHKEVWVSIEPSAKSNYQNTNKSKTIVESYYVWSRDTRKDKDVDLSKAKVTFYEGTATRATNKFSYTGNPIELTPLDAKPTLPGEDGKCYIVVEVNNKVVDHNAYTVEYVSNVNKGRATVVIKPARPKPDDTTTTITYKGGKVATFTIAARTLKPADWPDKARQFFGF